ncbi:hypothetical protein ACHAW5_009134 [Stephanodiscus triporus]|uniref:Uncharacterized protein n=1 Tax=Stephanodiscus triporus TaxID=2934178 RepID=A0ABD3NMK5_9STRA
MIRDDDGDLPLHFACCNGAPASLLRAMTTWPLGDPTSATVCNSKNRLAVDDYIEWYVDCMNEGRGSSRGDMEEASEGGDDSVDDGESEDGPVDVGDSDSDSYFDDFWLPSNPALVNFCRRLPRDVMNVLSATCREDDLRAAMWVLIEAAAIAVGNCTLHNEEQTHDEGKKEIWMGSLLFIHAAVIATKYSNFPAIALAACIWWRKIDNDDDDGGDDLLEVDSYGYLPLHWACGDISLLLASGFVSNDASVDRNRCQTSYTSPCSLCCEALSRFNTRDIPCSSIEFLLELEPAAARAPTRDGRLPLHLLVADGYLSADVRTPSNDFCHRQPWDDIKLLLKEFPEALGMPDPKSNLYPFQLAAASSTRQSHGYVPLENTYRLIMEDPSFLCQLLDLSKK